MRLHGCTGRATARPVLRVQNRQLWRGRAELLRHDSPLLASDHELTTVSKLALRLQCEVPGKALLVGGRPRRRSPRRRARCEQRARAPCACGRSPAANLEATWHAAATANHAAERGPANAVSGGCGNGALFVLD